MKLPPRASREFALQIFGLHQVQGKFIIREQPIVAATADAAFAVGQGQVRVVQVPHHGQQDVPQFLVRRRRSDHGAIDPVQGVPVDVLDQELAVIAVEGFPDMLEIQHRVLGVDCLRLGFLHGLALLRLAAHHGRSGRQ